GPPFEGTPKPHKIYVGRVTALDDSKGTIDIAVGDTSGKVELTHEDRYNPKHLKPSEFTKLGAVLRVSLLSAPEEHPGATAEKTPVPLRLELGPESALVALDARTREVLAIVGSYEAVMGGLDRASNALRQPGSAFKPVLYSYALHSHRFTPATMLDLVKEDPK